MKKALLIEAKKYYINLPYHNYAHAIKVLKNARKIISRINKKFDKDIVEHAILFHDAGYHLAHKRNDFNSKEELAASIAKKVLTKFNYPRKHIKKVMKCIISTNIYKSPRNIEEKIVRAADVADMKSYKDFLRNTKNLLKDYEKLHNIKVDIDKWKRMQERIIRQYVKQRIKLSKSYYDKQGKSDFHERVKRNLERYAKTKI